MNKKSIYLLSALGLSAASALTLSACRDYDTFDIEEATIAKEIKQYEAAWIEAFGVPDPNHTWGMDEVLPSMVSYPANFATRASGGVGEAGSVNVQRNMWCDNDGTNTDGSIKYKDHAIAKDIKVPGWPNDEGKYYTSKGDGRLLTENIVDKSTVTTNHSLQPVGDVTEYEIQYVSAWFRTHQNPESITLHLSDFFVQNVSSDADQLEYTKNILGKTGNNGDNVLHANDAIAKDLTNVTKKPGRETSNESMNYSLDYLHFKPIGASGDEPNSEWTHINNFNAGNTNYDPENQPSNNFREIKYVTSSGTEDFACRSSMATKDAWVNNWVLVHLEWQEYMADGQLHNREGYYLAFDFETETNETKVTCDGYYSNWIIKITPAYFNPIGAARRIMCEDLGGTFDFDFNDVVVDVAFQRTSGSWDGDTNAKFAPVISVQAAGGTMPIYVGKDPTISGNDAYEVHKLMGNANGDMTPVNVKDDRTHVTAIFRGDEMTTKILSDVSIWVKNTLNGNNYIYKINGGEFERVNLSMDNSDEATQNPYGNPNKPMIEGTEKTRAPRAFAVPTSVKWMKELLYIGDTYTKFRKWVGDNSYNSGSGEPWYNEVNDDGSRGTLFTQNINPQNSDPQQIVDPTIITPLTPLGVVSDEFATIQLKAYTGDNPIWEKLAMLEDDDQVTFTVVLHSTTQESALKAVMLPADVELTSELSPKPKSYQGHSFVLSDVTESRWKSAVWQESYGAEYNTTTHQQTYPNGYTYVAKFSFTKAQLMNGETFCGYVLLYIKGQTGTITIPSTGDQGSTTKELYIQYKSVSNS